MDIQEVDKEMIIHAHVPGVKKSDLQIRIERPGVLQLIGSRTTRTEEQTKSYHHIETASGRFQRAFRVPLALKASDVHAELTNGVLTIRVPKSSDESNTVIIKD